MPGVFISYRREDSSGYAGRLFDIISAHFGRQNTFMDLDTIQGGDNFTAVIEEKIGVSDVLVAVIGAHWLTVAEQNGTRRLDNPRDFVRLEIGKALERGIRVIPVLVGGAAMPRAEDLPADLRPLGDRQALEVRDAHFHPDADQLIDVLHKAIHGVGFHPGKVNRKLLVPAIIFGVVVVIVVVGILLFRVPNSGTRPIPNSVTHPGAASVTRPSAAVVTKDSVAAPQVTVPPADVAGKWSATVKYDWGDTYKEVFDFEVDGDEVSGTASLLGSARGILDGKLTGNRISFMTKSLTTISSDEKTYEDKHYYKGTVENDSIRFKMMIDSSIETHVPIHFVASKFKTN